MWFIFKDHMLYHLVLHDVMKSQTYDRQSIFLNPFICDKAMDQNACTMYVLPKIVYIIGFLFHNIFATKNVSSSNNLYF